MFAISMPVQEHGEVENGTRRRGVVQGLVAVAVALGRHYSSTPAVPRYYHEWGGGGRRKTVEGGAHS